MGQKVLVLKNDSEYNKRNDIDFQQKRLYFITQFEEKRILLIYHLETRSKTEISDEIKTIKDSILASIETSLDIPIIEEDTTIKDNKDRKQDYEKRKYDFNKRIDIISQYLKKEDIEAIKKKLEQYKTESSIIEIEGKTPLLKMSRNNWNFLYEGIDFDTTITGNLNFKKANNL